MWYFQKRHVWISHLLPDSLLPPHCVNMLEPVMKEEWKDHKMQGYVFRTFATGTNKTLEMNERTLQRCFWIVSLTNSIATAFTYQYTQSWTNVLYFWVSVNECKLFCTVIITLLFCVCLCVCVCVCVFVCVCVCRQKRYLRSCLLSSIELKRLSLSLLLCRS